MGSWLGSHIARVPQEQIHYSGSLHPTSTVFAKMFELLTSEVDITHSWFLGCASQASAGCEIALFACLENGKRAAN